MVSALLTKLATMAFFQPTARTVLQASEVRATTTLHVCAWFGKLFVFRSMAVGENEPV